MTGGAAIKNERLARDKNSIPEDKRSQSQQTSTLAGSHGRRKRARTGEPTCAAVELANETLGHVIVSSTPAATPHLAAASIESSRQSCVGESVYSDTELGNKGCDMSSQRGGEGCN